MLPDLGFVGAINIGGPAGDRPERRRLLAQVDAAESEVHTLDFTSETGAAGRFWSASSRQDAGGVESIKLWDKTAAMFF